jgi:hypothetical protein
MVTAVLHNPKSTLAGKRAVETSLTFDASGWVIRIAPGKAILFVGACR